MKCYKLFLVFILIAGSTAAQEIYGNLEGRISDYNNTPLPGANISITGGSLQGTRGSTSDDQGFFSILSLPPGLYKIKISYVGLQSIALEHVQVRLGRTTSLGKVQLYQQDVNIPELVVSGKRFITDPNSASYGGSILSFDFENLPVERNYQNMISLLPQANLSYYGDGVNIAGSTGFENKFFVDGVEVTDPLFGVFSTYLPYNFIREVEVKAGGYEAEFRSALGGVINVVTNSGTNEFHTTAFGFYTNNNFADHYEKGLLDPTQGNFNDYDVGVSLGGPIIRDKLWFFTAYNPTFANRDVSIPGFGIYVDRTIRHLLAAKFNWSAFEQLKFNFTISGDPTKRKAAGRNLLNVPDNLGNPDLYLQDIREGGINAALNIFYSPAYNVLLEGTFAHIIRHDTGEPLTRNGKNPLYNDWVNNYFEGGVGGGWDSYRYNTISKLTATTTINTHKIITGVEYKITGVDESYYWHNINRWGDNLYAEFLGRRVVPVQQRMPSVFIQDSWKLTHNFRIFGGLRWDGQYVITPNNKFVQKVQIPLQPRLGIIILPDDEGNNKFFGSFGRYSHELALGRTAGLFSDQGYDIQNIYYNDPRVKGTLPDSIVNFPIGMGSEIEDLRGQYFDEFSLGYERNLTKYIRVSAQGVYRVLQEAIDDGFVNSVSEFRIGNPGRGLLSDFPRPTRNYKALIITLEQHHNEHFNFLVSYVLSRNYGNYEGLFDAVNHGEFPNGNRVLNNPALYSNTTGLLPNDRTHLLKLSGSYRFSFGLITGLSFTAQSGTPLTEYWDTGLGLQLLSERGAEGRSPAIWDLNARFIYEVPYQYLYNSRIILDIFHIASEFKSVDINQFHYFESDENGNPLYLNTDYGKAFRYQQPMSMRLGIEVDF